MAGTTSETYRRIERAAQLRIGGMAWDDIARHFPGEYSNGDSCRVFLMGQHGEEWDSAYDRATRTAIADVEPEALLVGRRLLRSKSEDVQQRSVGTLLNHCAKLRAQRIELSGPGGGVIRFVFGDVADDDDGEADEADDNSAASASSAAGNP